MKITRIAARGDGVAEDGSYWPGTAPGDTVEGGAIRPGAHRQVPPCRHFGRCGGCQLQHVDTVAYRAFLRDRVDEALRAHGLRASVAEAHLSPPRARRRAVMQVARQGKVALVGFHQARSHAVVDMHECHVLRAELFALVTPLRDLAARIGLDQGKLHLTLTDQGVDLGVIGQVTPVQERGLIDFVLSRQLPRCWVDSGLGPAPLIQPEPPAITLSGVAVPFPPGAFLQATQDGEAALVAAVRAIVPEGRTLDLFAGLGTFALALGSDAVEGDAAAIGALRSTGRVRTLHRDLFRRPMTAAELAPYDAVVLDPPRAGAKEQMPALAAAAVRRIAYVSCNPATFARDAAVLVKGGWRLTGVVPVGQFLWSTHVELVAGFARA